MAGHSHWAGIKHKKGKADKQRSKLFSKLSREITVQQNWDFQKLILIPRLRSAVQAAREANMPKDNILRAIKKLKDQVKILIMKKVSMKDLVQEELLLL